MTTSRSGWYLIYTKSRHEKKVHTQLTELNIDLFLLLTKDLETSSDRFHSGQRLELDHGALTGLTCEVAL